jgi:hypothetical protein
MQRIAAFLYGPPPYSVFLAASLYAIGFVTGIVVPRPSTSSCSARHSLKASCRWFLWFDRTRTQIRSASNGNLET